MKIIENDKQLKLTQKLLKDEANREDRRQLAETKGVKKVMKRQWQKADEPNPGQIIEERILKRLLRHCDQSMQNGKRRFSPLIVASVALLLLAMGGYWLFDSKHKQEVLEYTSVLAHEHRLLTLPDSSKVWMQPGSLVKYAENFKEHRKVWLKGDVTFEVIRQEKHPFQVYIDRAFIEVKGTVFRVSNLRASQNGVTLFSGHVDIHTLTTGKVVSMHPNQHAIIEQNEQITIKEIGKTDWQDGRYKFNDTRLDSLASIIHNLYDIEVELLQGVPRHSLFNGNIRYDEPPQTIIEKICYSMGLAYRKEGNKFTIYK